MSGFLALTTKKDRIAFIREKLGTDVRWTIRGLVRIFENQTADEQQAEVTSEHNGIGFTGVDAEFLSSLAKQVNKGRAMSDKHLAILFKKMPKYARQLERISSKSEN